MLPFLRRLLAGTASSGSGEFGESLAADWLRRERGFRIVARNWRNPWDRRAEIDIVARDGESLVFVEVKTRSELASVSGYRSVNRRKRDAMRRACDGYLRCLPMPDRPSTFRFDVVEVALPFGRVKSHRAVTSGGDPVVRHFQNVSLFRKYYRR